MRFDNWRREPRSAGDRARALRIEASPNFAGGKFHNPVPTRKLLAGSLVRTVLRQLLGKEQRVPKRPLPIEIISSGVFARAPATGLRVTWLGHSSALLEIDGRRLLLDPVWAER